MTTSTVMSSTTQIRHLVKDRGWRGGADSVGTTVWPECDPAVRVGDPVAEHLAASILQQDNGEGPA